MTNPSQPPAPKAADSGESFNKFDVALQVFEILSQDMAGKDRTDIEKKLVEAGAVISVAVRAAQVELLSNLSRKIEPYLVDDPRQPEGKDVRFAVPATVIQEALAVLDGEKKS